MTEKEMELKIDSRNARLHPPRNLEAVKKSLDELGAGRSSSLCSRIIASSTRKITGRNYIDCPSRR